MEPRKIRNEDDARRCLAAAETSGRPRAAWAREHGVDPRSLHAWHVNLTRWPRVTGIPGTVPPAKSLRLVELVAAKPCAPAAYRVRCGVFEVEVVGDIDEERLGRLLRVMASSC